MVLRFGNITLLSLEELSGRLFSGTGNKMSIMKEGGRWEEHPLETTIYGINVEVRHSNAHIHVVHVHVHDVHVHTCTYTCTCTCIL